MYRVVRVAKGYEIKRLKGSSGQYHVLVRERKAFKEFHTFKTLKATVEFIEAVL